MSGLSACRCCAPVPLSRYGYGRTLNSSSALSLGQRTNAGLKQQGACTPAPYPDRGKHSDPPCHLDSEPEGLVSRIEQQAPASLNRQKYASARPCSALFSPCSLPASTALSLRKSRAHLRAHESSGSLLIAPLVPSSRFFLLDSKKNTTNMLVGYLKNKLFCRRHLS